MKTALVTVNSWYCNSFHWRTDGSIECTV